MDRTVIQKSNSKADGEAFYDRSYSAGFWKRFKLWWDWCRLSLGSIGGSGKSRPMGKKPKVEADRNNEKRKVSQIVVLPESSSITGDLVTEGDVKFHGQIKGNIAVQGVFVIGRGGVIRGDIEAQACTIGGRVFGSISCSGVVEVMDSGYLKGDVKTSESVMVRGKVRGNIRSSNKTSLLNSCSVVGDVESPQIRIDSGAEFRGSINCNSHVELPED